MFFLQCDLGVLPRNGVSVPPLEPARTRYGSNPHVKAKVKDRLRKFSNAVSFFPKIFFLMWAIFKVFLKICVYLCLAALGSSLLCAGFPELQSAGLLSSCGAWTPHRGAFSCCRARVLEHRLYSCVAQAELIRRTWDCPKPGTEFVSPPLVGRFLTTRPPRKSPFLNSLLNL